MDAQAIGISIFESKEGIAITFALLTIYKPCM